MPDLTQLLAQAFRSRGDAPDGVDARPLTWLMAAGLAGIVAVWASEAAQGQLAPWDRVLYPASLAWLALTLATHLWLPRWNRAARLSAVVGLNLVVLIEIGMVLLSGATRVDLYQLSAALMWAPLGLGCAFVFLPLRQALVISGADYACELVLVLWLFDPQTHPGGEAGTVQAMLSNAAVVQPLYVLMMVGVSLLRHNMQSAQAHAERLRQAASSDALTGLANRRAIDEWLVSLLDLVRLDQRRAAVLLIDVDHFKAINDSSGHAAGDRVLVELSGLLESQVRAGDLVGRWGGEEFIVLTPQATSAAALEFAERLCATVQGHGFSAGPRVTVSIGVAYCRPSDRPDLLLKRVDDALYAAKSGGRNRVCVEAPG